MVSKMPHSWQMSNMVRIITVSSVKGSCPQAYNLLEEKNPMRKSESKSYSLQTTNPEDLKETINEGLC